jgi:stage IV sporulation protein FB
MITGRRIFEIAGIPVFLHPSVFLSVIVLGCVYGVQVGSFVGLFVLLIAHELGHAALIRRFGMRPTAIVIHGAGAECRYVGTASPWQRAVIAWGGVLAQAAILVAVIVPSGLGWLPRSVMGSSFVITIGGYNLFMIAFNLIPIRPLDGKEAWSLLPLLYLRVKKRVVRARTARVRPKSRSRRR